jgi:hypothetical protein
MAVTGTYTNLDLITSALRKIGVVAQDEEATSDQVSEAIMALDRMLKAWQSRGYSLFTVASQSVVLTTSASYTLSPVRPVRINSVRFKRNGVETPMQRFTRQEYDDLPVKTTTGTPTCWHYDRQREAALLYIWPVLASASGETLEITYEREIEDVEMSSVADVPGEWWDAVVYGLASRLADDYGVSSQMVMARAENELRLAEAGDREGSLFFGDC